MLIFDIETDGLLDTTTKLHCLCIYDTQTDVFTRYADRPGYEPNEEGVKQLMEAAEICGHNVLCFDVPALKKLYPWFSPKGKIVDTLTCSRLIWTNLSDIDFAQIRKAKSPAQVYYHFPKKLIGSHSLKAWGYRLSDLKDTFGEETDWKEWSPAMSEYNQQDVVVTVRLWNRIQAQNYSPSAIELEHQFQEIAFQQEQNGFPFNQEKAVQYYAQLSSEREKITQHLQALFPPKDKGDWFTPKVNNAKRGYVKGQKVWRPKIVPFNPGSRMDIADRLMEQHKWQPLEFTDTGIPKVDEDILNALPWPETQELAQYFLVQKRLGQLAEGSNAWLKLVKPDGRIHGGMITNGAVTGRCTHSNPNMAQVPAVGVPWGAEFRSLFYAPEGWLVLGADASGLELRCLAHYMARYDGGEYAKRILEGDIHWANAQALGLVQHDERKDPDNPHHMWARNKVAKRWVYGFLYGAGDHKLGDVLGLTTEEATKLVLSLPINKYNQIKEKLRGQNIPGDDLDIAMTVKGAELRANFLKNLPALKQLVDSVKKVAKDRGWLKGLDGRRLHVRSQHSALNTLLQSAGALAVKKATCILWDDLKAAGLADSVQQVAHVHDEYQLLVKSGLENDVGKIAVQAFNKAGEFFNFRIPLDGEYKVGHNWAETH